MGLPNSGKTENNWNGAERYIIRGNGNKDWRGKCDNWRKFKLRYNTLSPIKKEIPFKPIFITYEHTQNYRKSLQETFCVREKHCKYPCEIRQPLSYRSCLQCKYDWELFQDLAYATLVLIVCTVSELKGSAWIMKNRTTEWLHIGPPHSWDSSKVLEAVLWTIVGRSSSTKDPSKPNIFARFQT